MFSLSSDVAENFILLGHDSTSMAIRIQTYSRNVGIWIRFHAASYPGRKWSWKSTSSRMRAFPKLITFSNLRVRKHFFPLLIHGISHKEK